ncbi:MAG: O-antigen ligase family protein [Burkholderiaceae bacterium]
MKIFWNDLADRSSSLIGPVLALTLASVAVAPTVTDAGFWVIVLASAIALNRGMCPPLQKRDWLCILLLSVWPISILLMEVLHGPLWGALDRPSRLLLALPLFFLARSYGIERRWIGWGCFIGVSMGLALAGLNTFVSPDGSLRAQAFAGNPISYGQFMLVLGALGCACWLSGQVRQTKHALLLGTACLLGGLAGTFLSGSRGVWIAAVPVALLSISYSTGTKSRWLLLIGTVLTFTIAGVVSPGVVDRGYELVSTFPEQLTPDSSPKALIEQTSIEHRLDLWGHGWTLFQQSPWAGVGAESLRLSLEQQADAGLLERGRIHLHNEWIQMLAAYGLVGAIGLGAFLSGIGWIFMQAWMIRAPTGRSLWAFLGIQLVLAIAMLTLSDSILSNMNRVQIYALLLAVCAGAMRHDQLNQLSSRKESHASQAGHCQA